MAKRVFFSFHYQDVIDFRVNVVRNHWLTKPDRLSAGFFDASIWEKAKKTGDIALKRLINTGVKNTSTTCVLIGDQTYLRPWVRYEILRSVKKGNKILGVHINSIKGKDQKVKALGKNPFDYLGIRYSDSGKAMTLLEYKNGKWCNYDKIDRSATFYLDSPAPLRLRGQAFKLSALYPVYDWVGDYGFNKFSEWVK
ncbi:TIR domain-containing protein [Pseudoalteromonas piscicida]|uniref:TIR domain-containing protein n=1 Tax=Pseudoalteromonas piscicida TaxID=43662 RepID=UPI0030C9B323